MGYRWLNARRMRLLAPAGSQRWRTVPVMQDEPALVREFSKLELTEASVREFASDGGLSGSE